MLVQAMPFPASGATSDPYWSNVVYLCGFEGASNAASDDSSKNHVPNSFFGTGNTGAQSTVVKFGTRSWHEASTGRGSVLSYPDSPDWAFGSGNFTIECWVRFELANTTDLQRLFGQWDSGAGQRAWGLSYEGGALSLLRSSTGTAAATSTTGTWAYTTNTWYHVAADWDGTTARVYVDGVMKGSSTLAVTIFDSTAAFTVGTIINNGAVNTNFQGYLDEVRITKGVARYASDSGFTPPTAAFPRG